MLDVVGRRTFVIRGDRICQGYLVINHFAYRFAMENSNNKKQTNKKKVKYIHANKLNKWYFDFYRICLT